ncbi:hypothetical protein [uncultured Tessaracoccus sp.]|uniref:hypothetical protein n=1 Tax=uncultured Tessaracoccus sp. TaxID=905023 RepID=UPI0025EBBAED|nr:hypothetical protein [uncultured Tessaracoccus sp.]
MDDRDGDFREYMRQETIRSARLDLVRAPEDRDRLAVRLATDLFLTVRIGDAPTAHLAADNAWLDQMDAQTILDVATMNTSVHLLGAHLEVDAVDDACWSLASESHSTATLITMLDEHVPTPEDRTLDLARGVLVAVPTSRMLLFGALDGPGSFLRNATTLIRHCFRYAGALDALSTSVYLVEADGMGRVAYPSWPGGRQTIQLAAPSWLRAAVERGDL